MQSNVDPKVDYAFKRLFGSTDNTPVLTNLLNAVLEPPPGKPVREVALRNPFSDKEYAEAKGAVLDVKAVDSAGRQYHLEMQAVVPWSFPKRFLFYWARLHAEQLREGDFHETLLPTYSIAFLNGTLFDDEHCHHRFRLYDDKRATVFCKDLELHTIELPRFKLTAEQCSTDLERWCYFLKHGDTLDSDRLPPSLDVPSIRQALEVLLVLSQNDLERQRYLDRLQGERDAASRLHGERLAREAGLREGKEEGFDEGWAKGLEKGEEKGREQGELIGREQGELIGRIHAYQRLLKQGLTAKEELLRLDVDALDRLAAQLEAQLLPKTNGAEESAAWLP